MLKTTCAENPYYDHANHYNVVEMLLAFCLFLVESVAKVPFQANIAILNEHVYLLTHIACTERCQAIHVFSPPCNVRA